MTQDENNNAWEAGFRAGFYAGFAATGEGWNAEYPFEGADITQSDDINKILEEAIKGESKNTASTRCVRRRWND
jgi:hypothetical protein